MVGAFGLRVGSGSRRGVRRDWTNGHGKRLVAPGVERGDLENRRADELLEGMAGNAQRVAEVDDRQTRAAARRSPLAGYGVGLGAADAQYRRCLLHGQQVRDRRRAASLSGSQRVRRVARSGITVLDPTILLG